ncbi:MAG: TonB-dependent receptor [Acidobacteriota bacterium]
MTKNLMNRFVSVAIFCVLICVGQGFAQSAVSGAISGKVSDPQGAVVPNAAVIITNIDTNAAVTVNTSDEGVFRVSNLAPGTYRVETTVSGFAPAKVERAIVEVGKATAIDFSLTVGTTTAVVQVTSEAPVINTTDNANATNIDQTQISELPINGRRASDFARLTPGVNPEGDFGLNSFRGLSSLMNNHTLDGTDNNNMFFSEERGRSRIQYSVSQAAVREFQVNSTNFSAEYGRAAGGVINTVTKSGTNNFRGEVFLFDRDNVWGASNPSATVPGAGGIQIHVKPRDVRYQYGFGVGGPIIKDKLFFFLNFDQQKRLFPGVATPQVRTAFDPITPPAGLTQAQTDAGLAFLRSLTGVAPRRQDQTIMFPKIDWVINGRNTLTLSYNRVRTSGLNAFQTPTVVSVGLADFGDDLVGIDTFNARLATTLSSTVINEFRFQRGRENARSILQTETDSERALAAKGNTVNGLLPSVSFSSSLVGSFQFGTSTNFQRAAFPDERTTQFVDSITATLGKHTLKTGGDIKFTNDYINNLRSEYGTYSYSSVANFILDYTSAMSGLAPFCSTGSGPTLRKVGCYTTFTQGFGLRDYTLKTPDYSFFVQDNWQIAPRLTLNLGLRYDYQKFPDPQFPNTQTPTLNTLTGTIPQRYTQAQANEIIARTGKFASDKNNFGPRLGFAWDIFGDNKTVIRGGYGLFYGRVPNTFLSSAVTNTGGVGSSLAASSVRPTDTLDAGGGAIVPPIFPGVLAVTPSRTNAALSITTMSPNFQNPAVHEVDIIFERQLSKNTAFSVTYLYTKATHLPAFVDLNLPPPTGTKTYRFSGGPLNSNTFTVPFYLSYGASSTTTRPITNFASIIDMESIANSTYNGLVLQIQRRMTEGLSFQANYTRSKATDQNQQFGTFAASFMTVSDPFHPETDNGISSNNIPHKFVGSAVWVPATFFHVAKTGAAHAILGDLQISPIMIMSTGYAMAATTPTSFPPSFSTVGNTIFGDGGVIGIPFLRNAYHRPWTWTTDLRISKRIRFGEHTNLEFLAEGFNIFNRTNVTRVNDQYISSINFGATSDVGILTYNPTYGTATTVNNTTIFAPRQIQFGVRLHF